MIQLIGVPTFAGALYPGTNETPAALRKHGLKETIVKSGIEVSDFGDLALPDYLPRHNTAPVRNWPSPRMVWETIVEQGSNWFDPEKVNLLLGGDCSIVVGVADHLASLYGDKLYMLVIDAHVDVVKPDPNVCVGAAAMGLWFLTNENLLWQKPATIKPQQITVLACQDLPAETYGIQTISLKQLRVNMQHTIETVLSGIPADGKILIHFDVDSIGKDEMPAAYAPSETGLTIAECRYLLTSIVADPRTIAMEVTEFSAIKDEDGNNGKRLVELLHDVVSVGLKVRTAEAL
ncbi:arginase family protein [Pontibacter sp. BT310]|uniref:Arginase family protein n=1 Tax=Pontibacter populi TaxID=890055 RepID=A0ABS6X8I2_9BACT|nr:MULTISPECIES: arginase family protein [Pontibacter]MBJ6117438.1 arginase family protein [Pontibacter sp. BT310]MBR0569863.1 arginase family protein [Microvirga sp. STS03]MBW3364291.1 arginase family protein [Pontibacter populi]